MKAVYILSAFFALAVAIPQTSTCTCEERFCVQSFPESCYCGNANRQSCFEKCGGVAPQYQDCGDGTFFGPATTTTSAAPTATPFPSSGPYERCGGFRAPQCVKGGTCIDDPFRRPGDCGIACDRGNGYCVSGKRCDGPSKAKCPRGEICVDDEGDDCNKKKKGTKCPGWCVNVSRMSLPKS